MTTRVLVIGDPHFKVNNVKETDGMENAIINIAQKYKLDFIVVLGDVLDRHENIHVSPLTRATRFLARLMSIAPTYVLIGNHDLKNNRQFLSDEHPFNGLKYWGDRMTVVDTTISKTINNLLFTFVPYVPPGRFIEALDFSNNWKESICIFGHQELKGVKMGPLISTEGDDWCLSYPFTVHGHVHDYQEPQSNVLYTGTPIQHAYGDRHDKTISYFEFELNGERKHERIDLGLPKKYIVYLSCADVNDYVPDENQDLKIKIRGTSGDIRAIMKHPNIIEWKKMGYKIQYKDIPLNESLTYDGPVISQAPQKFSKVLYDSISDNSRLVLTYNKVFGEMENTTNTGVALV